MSRNLATSVCCDNTVRLEDLRGKPIEFRRYSDEAPSLGTRWDCPTCGTAYFAFWRRHEGIVFRSPSTFTIDLSYYESFNDEHDYDNYDDLNIVGIDTPRHVCTDNAEDKQWVWR